MRITTLIICGGGLLVSSVLATPVSPGVSENKNLARDALAVVKHCRPVCDWRLKDNQKIGTCSENNGQGGTSAIITPYVCENWCDCKQTSRDPPDDVLIYCESYATCFPDDINKICHKNCSCPDRSCSG